MISNKIFIIGLPRTATTSVCLACLDLGFKTAHTAYTEQAFNEAQVIADTPAFNDYAVLDKHYGDAKFIYLERDASQWIPSVQQLLLRMYENLMRTDGGFNPHLKRCYKSVFAPFNKINIQSADFLHDCYLRHQTSVEQYFSGQPDKLLTIDVTHPYSYLKLANFLQVEAGEQETFKHMNKRGKVTAWKQISHPLKIEATRNGKVDKLKFLTEFSV
ncbi:sulfotransferase family protein [Catenovulum sediminis]|uniref:Sulfotransferase family protein n=1 Tax=Catenovulum sediminis TaxID=1740262 RepID=A0ABV1RFL0_9ALTE|nr:sulfotransferase family protein [Catenovulum sediminis]